MSDNSKIEWTDASWNCVTGCTKVSDGCDRCYAETFAERWRGIPGHHFEQGFDVRLWPDRMDLPLRWKRPRRVFVNSMSDMFHKDIPDDFIARMFAVMAMAPQHTFQVLTKRHGRMKSLLNSAAFWHRVGDFGSQIAMARVGGEYPASGPMVLTPESRPLDWTCASPLPNVWLGVSAEDEPWYRARVAALLCTPAAVRFVSAEPLLAPIGLQLPRVPVPFHVQGIHWVIAGGESGPGARPCELDWLRSLRDQCAEGGTAFFCKQLGKTLGRELGAGPKGGDWDAWPADLRVREFPAEPARAAA